MNTETTVIEETRKGSEAFPERLDWLPLILLTALAFVIGGALPGWGFMWALAFALFFGCKWLTWSRAWLAHGNPGRLRSLGYLFLWVGMDARPFFAPRRIALAPEGREWAEAWLKTTLGVALLWWGTRAMHPVAPTLAAWTGMIGFALAAHFGLFHLLALAWRRTGVDADPIMRSPALATSLSAFWSERWNRGFNELAHKLVFRPLRRRGGVGAATLAVFLVSGLVHDLLISLPAGAGFGLPTLYFLIQGLGVFLVRSRRGRRLGIHRGIRGWLITLLFTVGPVALLFHAPFIESVMLPFLKTLNAY